MTNNSLQHHGVLGMRWGFRKCRRTGKHRPTREVKAEAKARNRDIRDRVKSGERLFDKRRYNRTHDQVVELGKSATTRVLRNNEIRDMPLSEALSREKRREGRVQVAKLLSSVLGTTAYVAFEMARQRR